MLSQTMRKRKKDLVLSEFKSHDLQMCRIRWMSFFRRSDDQFHDIPTEDLVAREILLVLRPLLL